MVRVVRCKIQGCQARAWQGTLCNLHALERYRGKRYPSADERLQRGKALLQQRARELGVAVVTVTQQRVVVGAKKRFRSPVA